MWKNKNFFNKKSGILLIILLFTISIVLLKDIFLYNSSSISKCPEWFIKVPWNIEFNQPWFCVSKYEITYTDAIKPDSVGWWTDWNTMRYTPWRKISSKPGLYPIWDIIQLDAIILCESFWTGFHLVTNDEWMTIARNIEQVWSNWSWNKVWIGWLYRWITWEQNTNVSLWCATTDSNWKHIRKYVSAPLHIDTNKWGNNKGNDCDSKRQLILSNWEIIWDLSGNLWEHVNKANTLNWMNYDEWINPDPCNKKDGYYNWNVCTSSWRILYWPTNNLRTNQNWIWWVRDYKGTIFTRGSYAKDGTNAGIFSLCLDWTPYGTHRKVWFRCSK